MHDMLFSDVISEFCVLRIGLEWLIFSFKSLFCLFLGARACVSGRTGVCQGTRDRVLIVSLGVQGSGKIS